MSVLQPSLAFQGQVSRADLAALVDAAGEPSLLSPRPLLGPAALLVPAVSPAFADAARVVAAPRVNLTVRLWSGETTAVETNVLFAVSPAAGHGVVLNPVDSGYEVSGFVDAERLLAMIAPALPPEAPLPLPPFEVQGDADTMIVLAACLDLLRHEIVAARAAHVVARRPMPARLLDDARPLAGIEVATYVKEMWGFSRFGSLLTAAFPLVMRSLPPSLGDIDAALARLVDLDLLRQVRPDRFLPAPSLEPVLRGLLGMQAGLQWQRVSLLDDGSVLVSERLFLLGGGGAVFAWQPTAAGLLRLSLGTRGAIVDYLVAELAAPLYVAPAATPEPAPAAAPPVSRFCGACGATLKPQWKFCGACGAAVKETGHDER